MINVWQLGDLVRLSATYKDLADALVDPTSVQLEVTRPSGALDSYTWPAGPTLTRESLGVFRRDYAITERGRHYYRWISTGNGQAAEPGEFVATEA
jgi:hypothetical protein